MADSVLPPLNSEWTFLTNHLMVGYPLTSYLAANSLWTVESTLTKATFGAVYFNVLAALAYSGVNFLQWPHQGA